MYKEPGAYTNIEKKDLEEEVRYVVAIDNTAPTTSKNKVWSINKIDAEFAKQNEVKKVSSDLENIKQKISQISVSIEDFPRLENETDDSPRIQRCIDSITKPSTILFPLNSYIINSTININKNHLCFEGNGFNTTLETSVDINIFKITGNYNYINNMTLKVTGASRTKYTVETLDCARAEFDRIYFENSTNSLSGIKMTGGSMGIIDKCIFNHSSILLDTWDVKIVDTWVWTLSQNFGIKAYNGCGNLTLQNVDVVPPLYSNANKEAGIVLDSSIRPVSNVKMNSLYIDGNPILETGKGILITPNTFGVEINCYNANKCNDDVITIDSAFGIDIRGGINIENNATNRGGREIFIMKSSTQAPSFINIETNCIMTSSRSKKVPAIEIADNANNNTIKINSIIKQPTLGNESAYSDIEIKCNAKNKFCDTVGTRSLYNSSGSIEIKANATSITIPSLGGGTPLAYQPKPNQIKFGLEGATLPNYRLQFSNKDQVFVGFKEPISIDTTLYWEVKL